MRPLLLILLVSCVIFAPEVLWAQGVSDAEVLPQGVGALLIQPGISYGPGALERYGRGWQVTRESFIADFNGIDLSKVLAGDKSTLLDAALGGSLGKTSFQGSQQSIAFNFIAAFGITDRLTILGLLPFAHTNYTLDASLNGASSGKGIVRADLLKCDESFDLARDLKNILVDKPAPLGRKEVFNIEDLNKALGSPCLGYNAPLDRFEFDDGAIHGYADRTYSGFRDLILGAKYQFWHGRNFNLAGLGYVVLPTGKPDDPNDLFDISFGDGQTDAALLLAATIPLGRFRLGGSAGYEISFGDKINRRLNSITFDADTEGRLARGEISEEELIRDHLDDATMVPIVTVYDQAEVTRKLGDNIYVYSQLGFQIFEWLSVGVTLNFLHHFRDEVTEIGPRYGNVAPYLTEAEVRADVDAQVAAGTLPVECPPDTGLTPPECRENALKAGLPNTVGRRQAAFGWRTVRGNLVGGFGVSFNTLPMFLRNEFPLPIIASVSISRNLAGQNLDTPDAIQASLVIPFAVGDVLDPSTVGFDGEDGPGLPFP